MYRIIALSLFIIPFVSIVGQDIRELKGALAFVVMLTIGLLSVYKGKIKPFSNKWALILVGFVWLNIMLSPSSGLKLGSINLMQFWSWKPFCYILVYLLGIMAISSATKLNTKGILKGMVYAGFVMALLVIIQFFCLDQFFRSNGQIHEQWNLGGSLGHPIFVGAFMAMIVPLAVYLKKRFIAVIIVSAVLVTQSQVAIGAMALSLGFYFACKGRKQLIGVVIGLLVLASGVMVLIQHKPDYVSDSGRFSEWVRIVDDVNQPIRPNVPGEKEKYGKYPVTGRGLGSFYYTYHVIHKCRFFQAHNEYLEWLYNCGIIGVILLFLAILHIYKLNFLKNEYRTALLSSFTCIAITAGGLFVWQLGATTLYSAILVGLLHQPLGSFADNKDELIKVKGE